MFDRQGNRKYLNSPERRAFLKSATIQSNLAEKTFCLTVFHTGCRISEALSVPCARLDVSERTIIFETLKRRQEGLFRSVPIPDSLVRDLQKLVSGKEPNAQIWDFSRVTGWRLIKRIMARAKINGVRACPKGLRHGFAVECIANAIPLTTLQKWMGHARLETTAIYLQVMGAEERRLARRLWTGL